MAYQRRRYAVYPKEEIQASTLPFPHPPLTCQPAAMPSIHRSIDSSNSDTCSTNLQRGRRKENRLHARHAPSLAACPCRLVARHSQPGHGHPRLRRQCNRLCMRLPAPAPETQIETAVAAGQTLPSSSSSMLPLSCRRSVAQLLTLQSMQASPKHPAHACPATNV